MKRTKIQLRHKRISSVARLEKLESRHCDSCERPRDPGKDSTYACEGCPVFVEIRAIGEELNNLANQRRVDSAPKELTRTTYLELRDRGWLQEEICRHYDISYSSFNFFLNSNNLRGPNEEPKKERELIVKITVDEYTELKKQRMSDGDIAKKLGVHPKSIVRWKKRNGVLITSR